MAEVRGFVERTAQLLVAHTIGFDGEFERRMPHRTTVFGVGGPPSPVVDGREVRRPWLVSRSFLENVLPEVPRDGIARDALGARPGNLGGMLRWGYLREADGLCRLTRAGRLARRVHADVAARFDDEWTRWVGAELVAALETALTAVEAAVVTPTFRFFPMLQIQRGFRVPAASATELAAVGLGGRLSRIVQGFATEYESASTLSLALGSTVLPILSSSPTRVRDLPALTGISREAVDMGLGLLERHTLAVRSDGPAVALHRRGEVVRERDRRITQTIEEEWSRRVGTGAIDAFDRALQAVLASPGLPATLDPAPLEWRANGRYRRATDRLVADPAGRLPRYPFVLHRGGYPDGS